MKDNNYGDFDNFDDFFDDLLKQFNETDDPEIENRTAPNEDLKADKEKKEKAIEIKVTEGYAGSEHEDHKSSESLGNDHSADSVNKENGRNASASRKGSARKESAGKSIPFFLVLFAVTVLAWSLPLRPSESVSEKRRLEGFPAYDTSTLLSGSYFKSIDNWFSDTFTFRETWIYYANRVKDLYGIRTVAVYGDIPVADSIPVPSAVQVPESDPDPAEGGMSSLPVDIQPEDLPETDTEDDHYSAVQATEDEEDGWGGIVIDQDEIIADKGAKLQIGDSIFVYPGFNQHYAGEYAKRVNRLAELIKDKVNLYCLLVPENATSMMTRADREKYGFVIEEDAFDYIYSLMSEKVKPVNVISNLQKHNNEYIVFRSDHHWTALGAYYAYEAWCKEAGKEAVPISEYKEIVWEDFFGTYYYTAGQPKEITSNPDSVHAYVPPGDVHLYLDFRNSYKLGTETDLLVDRSTIKVDQYITFLGTDNAKATFINNDIDDDSAVLVLKDSFGNPFVYFLTQHYHYVYVADYRYFNYSISRFIENNKVDDVILINLANLMYSENGMNAVTRLYK